ncbi:MAG: DUF1223 domain-containing protein [Mangrovicoccus sp.]|nr:DUF1223 domain-containing protein [Mangrovicoccus sp.]
MRHLIASVLAALCVTALVAPQSQAAEDSPVLVELFTSQGCSACPPADALLRELAEQEGVMPLSLHVDYWDYIGWTDSFAQPRFTARQKAYARAGGRKSIYTPQMVIAGQKAMVGHEAMDVVMTIDKLRNVAPKAAISVLSQQGEAVAVQLSPRPGLSGPSDVHLVRFSPRVKVDVRRGENAGHMLEYANVVRDWTQLRAWDGQGTELQLELPGDEAALLIVQAHGHGPIWAVKRLK